jgi:putative transposase
LRLVEQHIIKKSNLMYKEIDEISFLSKNLYNRANYVVRQEFISTSKQKEEGKVSNANWIRYNQLQKQLQNKKDYDYSKLPAKVSQQVLKLLDKNWVSFFQSIRDWKKNTSKYLGKPSLPKYKHKTKGRGVLIYTIQAISKKELRSNIVRLSGTEIRIRTKQDSKAIQQVRVVPKIGYYIIEIVYEKKEIIYENIDKNKIAGIDLGLNNLLAVTSNQNKVNPLLINGRQLKSMNQYYNKKKAKLQSYVGDKSSNRLEKLTTKRNRKIKDYLHKASRFVVNHFISNGIGVVVIGKNTQWKTETNMGKRNNQSFVSIPHARLIDMITYKLKLVGIDVIITEESYTSKCSFIDLEPIKKHENYLGKRVKRGLFISKNKIKINADCNGSGNIIRKEIPNAFSDGIEGVVVRPIKVNLYKKVA